MGTLESLIISAVLAAFGSDKVGQIVRFARRFAGEKIGFAVEDEKSATSQAVRFAQDLVASGKVSDEFFDRLREISPDYADEIEQARQAWRDEQARESGAAFSGPPEEGPSVRGAVVNAAVDEHAAVRDERDSWLSELDEALDAVATAAPARPPQDWIDAAALLPSFDPRTLASASDREIDSGTNDTVIAMASLIEPEPAGQWILKRDVRREAVAGMVRSGTLPVALERARWLDSNGRYGLYRELLQEVSSTGQIEVGIGDPQDRLLAAQAISEWFDRTDRPPVNVDRLSVILEARDKLEPLRKLVGTHFRGRREELAMLDAREGFGPGKKRVLALTGIGGVGKSALLGRYVLSLADQPVPRPFVYLDFDRTDVDPARERSLIERMTRNLGLLYAGLASSRDFYAIEAAAAGDTLEQPLADWLPRGSTDEELLLNLNQRLEFLDTDYFVLIFDTFEQVALRGPDVMHRFANFLQLVLQTLPHARVILSGRGHIALPLDMHRLALKDLDAESADAVLEARGVSERPVRSRIVEVMGTSPLVLRLAAQAVKSGKLGPGDIDRFEAEARSTKVQGLLYTRILGHIRDPEIERLAHPGMVVRRVTPDVIRIVLADVCEIDAAQSETLFARLPNQIDLFEPASPPGTPLDDPFADPGALRHRQDLREAILEVMGDDPRWREVLPDIHKRAGDYYRGRPGLVARAEHVYHQLMLDADPEYLDTVWDAALAPGLARSWAEPIPVRARAWLGLRIGYEWSPGTLDLRLIDWEIRTARIAEERLRAGETEGALAVLRERTERTAASPLTRLEAQALSALGRQDEAVAVVERALAQSAEAPAAHVLGLHLLAAETAMPGPSAEKAHAHALRAAKLAEAAGDVTSKLRALEVLSRLTKDDQVVRELERTFVDTPERSLRVNEEVAARVVRAIGSESEAVMRKAALVFGDLPKQNLLTNDLRTWGSFFAAVRRHEGGEQLLAAFAPHIGLSSTERDSRRFATEVLRHGRRGEALTTVLTAFGKDDAIRAAALSTFRLPA